MSGLILALAMGMLLFSDSVMAAASGAAQVFVSGVLPSLLPMMVLGRLAPGGGALRAVVFGFASGSPASAQRALTVYTDRLEPLLAAVGVMSPMFFIGTLTHWTGNAAACWGMLLCHWGGALLTAGLWRLWSRPSPVRAGFPAAGSPGLAAAIRDSSQAMLGVCGAMMVFSAASALLKSLLAWLFPEWVVLNGRLLAILWALMEIGGGTHAVLSAYSQPPYALLCALCSFGGLSIWLQNLLFAGKYIRPGRLLLMRALHGAAAYGLCSIVFPFLSF